MKPDCLRAISVCRPGTPRCYGFPCGISDRKDIFGAVGSRASRNIWGWSAKNESMRKVMVFGAFDGIHAGHRAFFNEARHHGDYLMAVVAQNHIIEHLKGHLPEIDITRRSSPWATTSGKCSRA